MATETVNQSAPDHLHGYTPLQVKEVFERIAVNAEALRYHLRNARYAAEEHGAVMVANDIYIAQSMVAFIGAIADQMSGGGHIGSAASWATGDGIEPN